MCLKNKKHLIILGSILLLQAIAGLSHIRDPFIDGRLHYNWGPPFWLNAAEATNKAGFLRARFGVVSHAEQTEDGTLTNVGFYASHPQLMGPIVALWTRLFGYAEWSPRLLALSLTLATTAILFFSLRKIWGDTRAGLIVALVGSLPIIYIFGKKLDQEALVLFFLSITFFGYVKGIMSEPRAMPIFLMGLIGMTLSDWSGFVFVGIIAVMFAFVFRKDSYAVKRVLLWCGGAILVGLAVLIIQNIAQGDTRFIMKFFDLWRYRAGLKADEVISWGAWIQKQHRLIWANYTVTFFVIGSAGLMAAFILSLGRSTRSSIEKAVIVFLSSIYLGQLIYSLLVRHASYMHMYYQYYFALPLAAGAVWLVYYLMEDAPKRVAWLVSLVMSIGMIGFFFWRTSIVFRVMFTLTPEDITDIALLQFIGALPKDTTVAAVEQGRTWFGNPNIAYYAKRNIISYPPEHFPLISHLIVAKHLQPIVETTINSFQTPKKPFTANILKCSNHFCLIETK